ncbi:MAG: hypothetical protein V3R20_06590 [Sphingomonadales bacterium]
MNTFNIIGALCLSLALLSACAKQSSQPQGATYQPQSGLSESPGYVDTLLGDTTYKIEIYATPATSRETMREMGYRRAAEIALENGYEYFYITYAMDMTRIKTSAMTGVRIDSQSKPLLQMIIGLHSSPAMVNREGRTVFLAKAEEILARYEKE